MARDIVPLLGGVAGAADGKTAQIGGPFRQSWRGCSHVHFKLVPLCVCGQYSGEDLPTHLGFIPFRREQGKIEAFDMKDK